MQNGWSESASAWIGEMGDDGDFGRRYILDAPMMERVRAHAFGSALDVGCGEGRFSRMLRAQGIRTIGIDPTESLVAQARRRDPDGDYRIGRAEALEFTDGAFDLVVSYLTLIDIDDVERSIGEMVRVLRPGGTLLIANLTSFRTASFGSTSPCMGEYLTERTEWLEWRGIRIRNWHRPLSRYLSLLIGEGLILRFFDEPAPSGGDPQKAENYRRVPWFLVMEWDKA